MVEGKALVRNEFPSYSVNGDLVFQSNPGGEGWNLYVLRRGSQTAEHLIAAGSREQGEEVTPSWSPDGSEIVYARSPEHERPATPELEAKYDLWVTSTDGSGDATALDLPDGASSDEFFPAWSADGDQLAFVRADSAPGCQRGELWIADYDAAARSLSGARPLVQDADDVRHPSWGPDGRIVYSASAGGQYALFVLDPAQETPVPRPIALGDEAPMDAIDPAWSPVDDRVAFTGGPFTCTHDKFAPRTGFVSRPADPNLSSRVYVATVG